MQDFLFTDVAAVVAHSAEDQQLMNRFSKACQDFGSTISLKKTQVVGQGVDSPTSVTILCRQELELVHDFVYLGSTISGTLSLDVKLDKCIGKAATMLSRLIKRVCLNKKLMAYTKTQVYRACVRSTLLYERPGPFVHGRRGS